MGQRRARRGTGSPGVALRLSTGRVRVGLRATELIAAGCRPAARVHYAHPRQAELFDGLRARQTALTALYTLERELGPGGMATVLL